MSNKNEHLLNLDEDSEAFESDVRTINDFISIFIASNEQAEKLGDLRVLLYRT